MAFLLLLLLVTLSAPAFSAVLKTENCPGDDASTGNIIRVASSGIDNPESIVLRRNHNYTITIEFDAGEDSEGLEPVLLGIFGGSDKEIRMPWKKSGVPRNACKSLQGDLKCPLEKGKRYQYQATAHIPPNYPQIKVYAQWALAAKDARKKRGRNQACFRMHAQIE